MVGILPVHAFIAFEIAIWHPSAAMVYLQVNDHA
jgi:hypothetical protein